MSEDSKEKDIKEILVDISATDGNTQTFFNNNFGNENELNIIKEPENMAFDYNEFNIDVQENEEHNLIDYNDNNQNNNHNNQNDNDNDNQNNQNNQNDDNENKDIFISFDNMDKYQMMPDDNIFGGAKKSKTDKIVKVRDSTGDSETVSTRAKTEELVAEDNTGDIIEPVSPADPSKRINSFSDLPTPIKESLNDIDESGAGEETDTEEVDDAKSMDLAETSETSETVNPQQLKNLSDLFEDLDDVEIEVTEEIPEYERVYRNEEIYRRDLQNIFLRKLPVDKQNNPYLQKEILKEVDTIIDMKNFGVMRVAQGGVNYFPIKNNYLNHRFGRKYTWLYPSVLDLKKIYRKINPNKPVDLDTPPSQYFTDSLIPKDTIKLVDQANEMKLQTQIEKQYKKGEISYKKYIQLLTDLIEKAYIKTDSFKKDSKTPVGYNVVNQPVDSTVLRHNNIQNIFWQNYVARGRRYIPQGGSAPVGQTSDTVDALTDVLLPSSNAILDELREQSTLVLLTNGHNLRLMGSLVFSIGTTIPSNKLNKIGEKVVNIKPGKNTTLTFKEPHNIVNKTKVMVKNSEYKMLNDKFVTATVLNDTQISVPVPTKQEDATESKSNKRTDGTDGTDGANETIVYARTPLKIKEFIVSKNTSNNFYDIFETKQDGKKGNKVNEKTFVRIPLTGEEIFYFRIDNQNILPDEYSKFLDAILPRSTDVLHVLDPIIRELSMASQVNRLLENLFQLKMHDFKYDELKNMRQYLADNIETLTVERQEELKKVIELESKKDKITDEMAEKNKKITPKQELIKKRGNSSSSNLLPTTNNTYDGRRINSTNDYVSNVDIMRYLYQDKFFYAPEVINVYGEYPLKEKDKNEESFSHRQGWLNQSADMGIYYYNYVNKQQTENVIDNNEKSIEKTMTQIKSNLKSVESELSKERKVLDNFNDKCEKRVSTKDKLKLEKANDIEKPSVTQDLSNICFFNTEKTPTQEEMDKIIENMKFTDMGCTWDTETGACQSSRYLRFNNRKEFYKDANDKYTETYANYKSGKLINSIEKTKKMNKSYVDAGVAIQDPIIPTELGPVNADLIKKMKMHIQQDIGFERAISEETKIQAARNVSIPRQDVSFSISEILNKIARVENAEQRKYLIFRLIEADGMVIRNYVYSRKYQTPMLCGHWNYLKLIEEAGSNKRKASLQEMMIETYGDSGGAQSGYVACKVCGNILDIVEYDYVQGFDDDGKLIVDYTVIESDKELDENNDELIDNVSVSYCKSPYMKRLLFEKNIEPTKAVMEACEIIHSFMVKLNISVYKSDISSILLDVIPFMNTIPEFDKFRKIEVAKLQKQGQSKKIIQRLNQKGYFRDVYKNFVENRRYTIIGARILIMLQTSVPGYIISSPQTTCVFEGIVGDKGLDFFTCLIADMEIFGMDKIKKDKEKYLKSINDNLRKMYNGYKEMPHIDLLYKNKEEYIKLKGESIIKDELEKEEILKRLEAGSPKQNELDEPNNILKRQNYLGLKAAVLAQKAIKGQATLDPMALENGCCLQPVLGYTSYYTFVGQGSQAILNEIYDLEMELTPFMFGNSYNKRINGTITSSDVWNKGTISRHYFPKVKDLQVHNSITWKLNLDNLNDVAIVKEKFLQFCSVGDTKGTLHMWEETGENDLSILSVSTGENNRDELEEMKKKKCVKCGQTYEELLKKDVTDENMKELFSDISLDTMEHLVIDNPMGNMYLSSQFDDINKNDIAAINGIVLKFVTKIVNIVYKNSTKAVRKEMIEKYSNILLNMGSKQDYYDEKNKELQELKKMLLEENKLNMQKLQSMRNTRNHILRDYLGVDISFDDSELIDENDFNRMEIYLKNQQLYNRSRMIKQYFNSYFRAYLSMVKNNAVFDAVSVTPLEQAETKKKAREKVESLFNSTKILDFESLFGEGKKSRDKNVQTFQEMAVEERSFLEEFVKPMKRRFFMELDFQYSSDTIRYLYGYADRYNCDWDTIVYDSPYDLLNNVQLLTYLLIEELNTFVSRQTNENGKLTISQFILAVLDKIEENEGWNNVTTSELEMYNNTIKEENKSKELPEVGYERIQKQYEEEQQEIMEQTGRNYAIESRDFNETLRNKIRTELYDEKGYEPTETEIDEYSQSYKNQEGYDLTVVDKDYDLLQPKEGLEIMDIGKEYGELPQNMNTAGDGISDYSMSILPSKY